MRRSACRLAMTLLPFLMIAVSAPHAAAQSSDAVAVTVADPAVAESTLELLLLPLTEKELIVEADAWQALLAAKVTELSRVEIEARTAEGEARDALRTRSGELHLERDALIARFDQVIVALEAKGGATESYEKYLDAVSGVTVDVTDAGALWTFVVDWIQAPEGGVKWGLRIVLAIVLLVVFRVLGSILGRVVARALGTFRGTSDMLKHFLVNVTRKATMLIGIVVALSVLGIEIGPFVAAIGVVGFIVGFALQGTLSNFASGIMILLYRPYDVGDWVETAGVSGAVKAMTLVSTTIRTGDNRTVVVPNNSIWGDVITNVTGNDTRRVDLVFGIGYGDDIAKAQRILEELTTSHGLVLPDPAPVIRLHALADSSVNFIVRPWVKTPDYWTVHWELTRAVKERFDAESISIPYPQRDVHVHRVEAAGA